MLLAILFGKRSDHRSTNDEAVYYTWSRSLKDYWGVPQPTPDSIFLLSDIHRIKQKGISYRTQNAEKEDT